MKKQKKSAKAGNIIVMCGMAFLCFMCGYKLGGFIGTNVKTDLPPWQEMLMCIGMIALIGVAVFIQTIFHEAGHLVAGLLSGYRFSSFRIGNFMLVKENEKMKCKRLSLAGTGGQCLMIPPDMIDGKIPFVLYNLGGSLMNLVMAASLFVYIFCAKIIHYFQCSF